MTRLSSMILTNLFPIKLTATISYRDEREDLTIVAYVPNQDTARVVAGRLGYGWGEPDDVSVSWIIYRVDWDRETTTEVEKGQYGWVQELAPPGFVQALPVPQHGDPELPPGTAPGSITGETFPATVKALNIIRMDSGGPSWPPQSTVTIASRWVSYMSRIEQGLSSLREDQPAPEDLDACQRWETGATSFLNSEFSSFCIPCDDVGEQMSARSGDLWLASQFLEDFFDGWSSYTDEGFDARIQELIP